MDTSTPLASVAGVALGVTPAVAGAGAVGAVTRFTFSPPAFTFVSNKYCRNTRTTVGDSDDSVTGDGTVSNRRENDGCEASGG